MQIRESDEGVSAAEVVYVQYLSTGVAVSNMAHNG